MLGVGPCQFGSATTDPGDEESATGHEHAIVAVRPLESEEGLTSGESGMDRKCPVLDVLWKHEYLSRVPKDFNEVRVVLKLSEYGDHSAGGDINKLFSARIAGRVHR